MHNLSLIIASQPLANAKFNRLFITEITGVTKINVRKCHSNETQINMNKTVIIESNTKLAFTKN